MEVSDRETELPDSNPSALDLFLAAPASHTPLVTTADVAGATGTGSYLEWIKLKFASENGPVLQDSELDEWRKDYQASNPSLTDRIPFTISNLSSHPDLDMTADSKFSVVKNSTVLNIDDEMEEINYLTSKTVRIDDDNYENLKNQLPARQIVQVDNFYVDGEENEDVHLDISGYLPSGLALTPHSSANGEDSIKPSFESMPTMMATSRSISSSRHVLDAENSSPPAAPTCFPKPPPPVFQTRSPSNLRSVVAPIASTTYSSDGAASPRSSSSSSTHSNTPPAQSHTPATTQSQPPPTLPGVSDAAAAAAAAVVTIDAVVKGTVEGNRQEIDDTVLSGLSPEHIAALSLFENDLVEEASIQRKQASLLLTPQQQQRQHIQQNEDALLNNRKKYLSESRAIETLEFSDDDSEDEIWSANNGNDHDDRDDVRGSAHHDNPNNGASISSDANSMSSMSMMMEAIYELKKVSPRYRDVSVEQLQLEIQQQQHQQQQQQQHIDHCNNENHQVQVLGDSELLASTSSGSNRWYENVEEFVPFDDNEEPA